MDNEILSIEGVYDIIKHKKHQRYDAVYCTLLVKPDYLTILPDNESYSILHYIVLHGLLDLFNKVIAIPNIRLILLSKTATRPSKDVLQISHENQNKSNDHKKLYETIDHLVLMDKFVEHGKLNQVNECKRMLEQDEELVNQKPPYRKYYLIHHLAYANDREAFDKLRQLCHFDMTLLTSDKKTASEVAFERDHKNFAKYLESLSSEMRTLRKEHEKEREKRKLAKLQQHEQLEKGIIDKAGHNMLDCFTCPLTKELFHDPVVLSDGFTYERSAIQHWLDLGNRNSPMTNIKLTNITLEKLFRIKRQLFL